MNPEEGMLRPQILDRFGLYIPVEASMSPDERAEIVERVEEFARDPIAFYRKWEPMEKQIEERIARAREIINSVTMDRDLLKLVTTTVVKLGIKTHRAEIVTVRTAKAIAALDGRTRVNLNDVLKAMELALRHRLKSKPFEEPQKRFEEVVKGLTGEKPEQKEQEERSKGSDRGGAQGGGAPGVMGSGRSNRVETLLKNLSETPVSLVKEPYNDANIQSNIFGKGSREFKTIAIASFKGVAIDAIPPAKQMLVDVDLPASLRASVALNPTPPIAIRPSCIRVRVRKERVPALHTILLDTSGSMLIGKRISVAKHILKTLMEEAYVKRTFVSLIVFRGEDAVIIAEPTRNLEAIFRSLEEIPVGGSTPFTAALLKALNYFKTFKRVFKEPKMVLHIISDGRANIFLTKNPRKEILELAEEYRRLGVEVVTYNTALNTIAIMPDYMKLFAEAVGGRYYKYR